MDNDSIGGLQKRRLNLVPNQAAQFDTECLVECDGLQEQRLNVVQD